MRSGDSRPKKGDAIPGSSRRLKPWILYLFFIIAALATYLVRHHVFFWDTVQLGSKHAHFYYETSFSALLLPVDIDSGHPPTFGLYIALMWSFFGKTLPVSHFAMLPFIWGIIYFLWQLGKHIAGERKAGFLLLLAMVDPTLAAQCLLVSPDVVLACFFLMGLFAILQQRNALKALAMLGLAMISMRGMMTVAALFLFEIAIHFSSMRALPKLIFQQIGFYLPAGLFGIAFLGWHYTQTGWIGYHPASPWAPSFAKVDASGFFKNVAVLGWRMLDFGRIVVWMVLIYLLWQNRPIKSVLRFQSIKRFLLLLVIGMLVLTPTLLLYEGLSAHRYLLPIYLSLTMLVFAAIFQIQTQKISQYGTIAIAVIGLLLGNSWIYPDKISQGWDATLAHLPYYQVRSEMLEYIENQQLPLDSIGTAFPEIGLLTFRDLSGRTVGFAEKELSTQAYILYSNVMNDFTDAEIDRLQQHWTPIQTYSRQGVRMVLYRK